MILVKISGIVNKKMLVSANIQVECLREKVVDAINKKKGVFIVIKTNNGGKKICSSGNILRELH